MALNSLVPSHSYTSKILKINCRTISCTYMVWNETGQTSVSSIFVKTKTYLTSTSTIRCSMGEKEGNIWTNLTWPFLKFLLSGNTTIKLISCPKCSSCITASTTKSCSARHLFIKMNLQTSFNENSHWKKFADSISADTNTNLYKTSVQIKITQRKFLPKRNCHSQSSSYKG